MRICLSLLTALCALSLLAGGAAPAGEKADLRIEPGARKPDPLAKKINFEFKKKPLSEVCEELARLSGAKVTCDKELVGKPITLKMTKATIRLTLDWVAKLAGAEAEFREDGSVRITKHPKITTVRKVYDVSLLAGGGKNPDGTPKLNTAAVEEMIIRRISPDTWGRNKRSLSARDGKLVVLQTKEVHKVIAQLLKDLRPAKPAKKETLEFIDTPAKDVVAYVARRGKLNIVTDPSCNKLMETKLTFKAEGMKLRQVLDWALRLSGTERQFKDGMIYITPKGKAKRPDAREVARDILLKEKDGVFREPAKFEPPPEVTLPVMKK